MYCECGCGQKTRVSPKTSRRHGYVKGEPRRFVLGHSRRCKERYRIEDRGSETPCWVWQLYIGKNGYGYDRGSLAHRRAYEEAHGPIPSGLVVDHLCRVRECVNPAHMEVVPQRVNVLRGNAGHNLRRAAKLTVEDQREIRRLRAKTSLTLKQLAARFGVSESRISQIARGECLLSRARPVRPTP